MNEERRINLSNKKIIILVFLAVILLIGATLAASVFSVFNGSYVYKTTCFDITYDSGEDITGTMFPSKIDKSGLSGNVSVGIDPSCGVAAKGNLYLNIDSSTSNKFIETVTPHCENKYTLATLSDYTTSNACNASDNNIWVANGTALKYSVYDNDNLNMPVSIGYINQIENPINIYKDFILKESSSYIIYIWLDGELVDNSYSNLSFFANISTTVEQSFNSIEEPVLDDGMIPVIISDDGTVTTISKDDRNWYDYDNKKWANMILVNEDANESIGGSRSREAYLNNVGVEVLKEDILAYYVWIPRYKYKIWTTGVSSTGNEQEIDIQFELKNEKFSLGNAIGEYRTHPAFWWDDNNDRIIQDNEKLAGIWVGKFETTGTTDRPTVLPNTTSLVLQDVSTQFQTSLKFADGIMDTSTGDVSFNRSNVYGLSADTDSHMMKNSEWGVAAYLSHSKYGINEEIYSNNSNGFYTGRSSGTVGSHNPTSSQYGTYTWTGQAVSEDGTIGSVTDKTLGTKASTTGNITGIYDMSGGAWEYVMGHYGDMIAQSVDYSNFVVLPSSKYYDLYLNNNNSLCTLESCGGHALFETNGWYSSSTNFVGSLDSESDWFIRGGHYDAGRMFSSSYSDGSGTFNYSFRSVLIPKDYDYVDVTFDAQGGLLQMPVESDISYLFTTAGEHIFTVPYKGTYKLEVWGAQGGMGVNDGASKYMGGYGGYSSGFVDLNAAENIYINVGGMGGGGEDVCTGGEGGYNGGGTGGEDSNCASSKNEPGAGGGGATHIAMLSGELSTLASSVDSILIVAGGGGGGGWDGKGGSGGGVSGSTGNYTSDVVGTQTSGYAFGLGGNGISGTGGGGGGGGGYYGGAGGTASGGDSGNGGSGYIGNVLLSDKVMYCYNCTTSDAAYELTYSTTDYSDSPTSNYAKSGEGAAIVTLIEGYKESLVTKKSFADKYGQLPIPYRYGYEFLGWYTQPDGGVLVTEDKVINSALPHTLYAKWNILPTYQICFDENGGSGAPDCQTKVYGETLAISDVKPEKTGYVFMGWSLYSNATTATIDAGGELTINNDANFYAVWREINPTDSYSCANGTVGADSYYLTYTGNCEVIDDGGGDWRVKFLTTGTLTINEDLPIDAFLVGGGGAGGRPSTEDEDGGGGGGGYTKTSFVNLVSGNPYVISIGAGGSGNRASGSETTAFELTANGGGGGGYTDGGDGGSGGGGDGGAGGSNGGDGSSGTGTAGTGQGRSTCEFEEDGCETDKLYAGGGGGGSSASGGAGGGAAGTKKAAANTGGGGGGSSGRGNAGGGGSGIVVIRNAKIIVERAIDFEYTGDYTYIDDGNGNWRIKFLTSGTFTPSSNLDIDVFLVGGGGGGGRGQSGYEGGGGGGGGGYTLTEKNIDLLANNSYEIVIGAGGASRTDGTASTAFGLSAAGGKGSGYSDAGAGGSGGGGGSKSTGAAGGTNGGDGISSYGAGGVGQGLTTCEFGEGTFGGVCNEGVEMYAGGGGGGGGGGNAGGAAGTGGGGKGGKYGAQGGSGKINTGGGGGGGGYREYGGSGGTGIVIVRNER